MISYSSYSLGYAVNTIRDTIADKGVPHIKLLAEKSFFWKKDRGKRKHTIWKIGIETH